MRVEWYIYNVEGSYFPMDDAFRTKYDAETALEYFFADNKCFYEKNKEDYIIIPRIVED